MRTLELDITEKENKFIVTIDKSQLSEDYILKLVNWLQNVRNAKIRNINDQKNIRKVSKVPISTIGSKQRSLTYSGSVDLSKHKNNMNLRDFAYE